MSARITWAGDSGGRGASGSSGIGDGLTSGDVNAMDLSKELMAAESCWRWYLNERMQGGMISTVVSLW